MIVVTGSAGFIGCTLVTALNLRSAIEYIPFPEHLEGRYQSFTQADITASRGAGCAHRFHAVEQGVKSDPKILNKF